jgi:UDP-N-acetylmuramate dehydrogenase
MTDLFPLLADVADLRVEHDAPLSQYTRFGLGGPASMLADASTEDSFIAAVTQARAASVPLVVIGGGSNLVVADRGWDGLVLRYVARDISASDGCVIAEAGAELQSLVDFSVDHGLAGIHTMTGIPGWVGGAVYGNAGAYGRSMHESVAAVRFFDGTRVREFSNAECGFRYRHSTFKDHKNWVIFATRLALAAGDAPELRRTADEILAIRNAKYPPTMQCAGSIFKNLILAELPEGVQRQVDPKVVREGKVPSAWFLEQVGAKGIRSGGIQVADYHANLIYNTGGGRAAEVREVVDDLKRRVRDRFSFDIEEEIQYVGF